MCTPETIGQNAPKTDVFVKLSFLSPSLFGIREKLQKLFTDKQTSLKISKLFLRHLLESKAFPSSRISYLRCYLQELFTMVSFMLIVLWPVVIVAVFVTKDKHASLD